MIEMKIADLSKEDKNKRKYISKISLEKLPEGGSFLPPGELTIEEAEKMLERAIVHDEKEGTKVE